MIRCEDWRNASADTLQALYRLERARWIGKLHWDAEPTLHLLEQARASGRAPGLIALDAQQRPLGWAYYILHHRMLQIGGLVAASGEVTRALLDAVLSSPEADMAADLLCFAFPSSPALESALTRKRFATTRYLYLSKDLSGLSTAGAQADGRDEWHLRSGMRIAHWHELDGVATVRLLARAYAGVPSARCFAPRGTLEEWATYFAQLVKMPACGRFLPAASLTATDPSQGPEPRGVVIATTLQPDTAHIAQIMVDPSLRRRGLARDLIETTSALAASMGHTRLTLLVSEDNAPARALYASAGFTAASHFLYATRQAPTRMRGMRPAQTLVTA